MHGQNTSSSMFRLNLMSRLLGVQSIRSIFSDNDRFLCNIFYKQHRYWKFAKMGKHNLRLFIFNIL